MQRCPDDDSDPGTYRDPDRVSGDGEHHHTEASPDDEAKSEKRSVATALLGIFVDLSLSLRSSSVRLNRWSGASWMACSRQSLSGQGQISRDAMFSDVAHDHFPFCAVDAALSAQRSLDGLQLGGERVRIRMGLHTGPAQERDGDYFGITVNRAARISSAAQGGQVLVAT